MKLKRIAALLMAACMIVPFGMTNTDYGAMTVSAAQIDWDPYFDNEDSWFGTSEATAFADEIIQYQLSDGGWRKEMTNTSVTGSWAKSTIDNEATTSQIIYLAKVYNQTQTEKYKTACLKGIDLLINGQYDNGGWPQVFNDAGTYHAHITYNDTAMVRVLEIMQDVSEKTGDFAFIDNSYAARAKTAVDKGIECILDTQITVNGKKTAWCQQHDETTLEPASARAYELPSISSSESVGIVNFLKSLDNPSNEIIRSINAAVTWMDSATLYGIKIESYTNSDGESDKRVVSDSGASPLWARFYYLTDGVTPMFVSRESVAADNWDHIGAERRTGYSWYGTWPKKLVAAGLLEENPEESDDPDFKEFPNNLYVGYPSQENNFDTVQEAVNAAAKINPSSESQRVGIHIAPGTYREQIVVNTPYITFVNDTPSEDVLLTWYYGIGYKYYSVGSDGYYSAENAASKSAKTEPTSRWGSSVGLKSNADYFRAEYITFENSFNRYVTAEEIADGVEPSGSQKITFDRTASGADVTSKTATERAAAIAIDGDCCEFLECEFLSSQDTLFTGGNQGYFKNCFIQGNTDYIFGNGSYVFENCELSFGGYSASAAGGYITAHKGTGGYLFYNCDITANNKLTVSPGYFGRPWGAEANVAFVNTTLQYEEIITAAGWYKMSDNTPENANYKEFNTTANGKAVNTSGRTAGTVVTSDEGLAPTDYFGQWVPYYYTASDDPDVPEKPELEISAILDAGKVTKGTYTSLLDVNSTFSITAGTEKTVTVADASAKTADGKYTVNGVIQLGGGGAASYRSIKINAEKKGELTVYMMSSNAETPRTVNLLDAGGNVISTTENVVGSALNSYTIEIPSAGEYYLASASSGLNVYYAVLSQSTEAETITINTGDVNDDGKINVFDFIIIKENVVKNSWPEDTKKHYADVTGDDVTDKNDVRTYADFLLGKKISFAQKTINK